MEDGLTPTGVGEERGGERSRIGERKEGRGEERGGERRRKRRREGRGKEMEEGKVGEGKGEGRGERKRVERRKRGREWREKEKGREGKKKEEGKGGERRPTLSLRPSIRHVKIHPKAIPQSSPSLMSHTRPPSSSSRGVHGRRTSGKHISPAVSIARFIESDE